jgi:hypothetical protein
LYTLIFLRQMGIRFSQHETVRSKRVAWQNILWGVHTP